MNVLQPILTRFIYKSTTKASLCDGNGMNEFKSSIRTNESRKVEENRGRKSMLAGKHADLEQKRRVLAL